MVEQPIVLLNDQLKYPLSITLNSIIKQSSSIAFAGSVLYMIPIIILYFYFEEHIISGLSNMKF
jgi:multiple sugar transport system permease protein